MPYARRSGTITTPWGISTAMCPHPHPSRHSRRPAPPPPGLFRDVVLDPERDVVPDALPLISLRPDDEPDYLREVRRRARAEIELRRRGVEHGTLAVLEPLGLLPPRARRRRREVVAAQRWRAAQPLFLPQAAVPRPGLAALAGALRERLARGELAAWLEERGVSVLDPRAPLFDAERDLARAVVAPELGQDLWLKAGRLSTHAADRSLRLRVSFGREEDDDASQDEARHRAVARLGRDLLPGATDLLDAPELFPALSRTAERELYATQGIAYWNAPNGGARFHHDSFHGEGAGGQRGVLYWQATGSTVWLALSIEDLAARVRELLGWLAEGELAWLRAEIAPTAAELERLQDVAARRDVLLHELARPACGILGPIVDGPVFTALLADAGHALLLEPGDALLLPNHGLDRTAMHSVFHAGGDVAYGLSFGLREARP